jgi:hypothetical protein
MDTIKIDQDYAHYDLRIEGMKPELADKLLDIICLFAQSHGLSVGGGVDYEKESELDSKESSGGINEQETKAS